MRQMTVAGRTALVVAMTAALLQLGCGRGTSESVARSPEWNRFRGPDGQGVSTEEGLPVHWSEDGAGVRWTVEVPGPGVSSPIVNDWKIFLTGEEIEGDTTDLKVIALDLRTGERLWETTVLTREREPFPVRSVNNTSSGPTPVTDGERIYAYFGTHLAALDFSGELLWIYEVDSDYLDHVYYGAGSSLVLAGDKLLVLRDREKVAPELVGWLGAYDKLTGKRLWRKKWQDTCCSYTTPILYEGQSGTEILITQAGRFASFELETGKRLWTRPQKVNQPVASPVLAGDLLCSSSGGHGVKNVTCWKMRANNKGNTRPEPLWASNQGVNSIASAVLYNGLLFSVTDEGVMYCFDAKTGRALWRTRLERGNYSASLTAGDGKIYAFSRWGSSSVIAAASRFELLALNTLPHRDVVATPAVADGCLLVRTNDHLMCVEGAPPPAAEEATAG